MVGSATQDQYQRKDQKSHDGEYLDGRQPELDFPKVLNAKVVNQHNYNQENGDEDSGIDLFPWYPILDHKRGSSQLVGCDDNV